MAEEENPIRWTRNLSAADWIGARLDRPGGRDRVTALVPAGYEAYARILHPPGTFPPHQLPRDQLPVLVDILRGETTTPDRCWFCVSDRLPGLDAQGVTGRVRLPGAGASYLMHGGPIERALLSPPGKPLQVALPEGAPMPELLAAVSKQLSCAPSSVVLFSRDTTRAELEQELAAGPPNLRGRVPDLWWPADRAWFICIPRERGPNSTFVAGTRRLIHRLLVASGLEAVEARGTDPLSDAVEDERERTFGPVIASGTDAGRPWSLRGRIGPDGAAIWVETTSGGGGSSGALPFQDLGWQKLGHFGSLGWGEKHGVGAPRTFTVGGVVSKQTAAVDVRLADGTILPARIIDTGDPRANFFVAVWSSPDDGSVPDRTRLSVIDLEDPRASFPGAGSSPRRGEAVIARDATGAELETHRPR